MPDDKITLESGRFDWEAGRGYETPADGGRTMPPGWGDPPEFKDREQPAMVVPRAAPPEDRLTATEFLKRQEEGNQATTVELLKIAADRIAPEVLRAFDKAPVEVLQNLIYGAQIPSERVNLDTGTAVFRGHEITLSDDGRAAIKTILAMEVCRVLDEEKARVLKELGIGAMFDQEVPGDAGGGADDVFEVPGPAEPVEPEAPGVQGEVQ